MSAVITISAAGAGSYGKSYLTVLRDVSEWAERDRLLQQQGLGDSPEHLQEGLGVLAEVHAVITRAIRALDQAVKRLQGNAGESDLDPAPVAALRHSRERFSGTWVILSEKCEEIHRRLSGRW